MENYLILLPILIPLAGCVVAAVLGRYWKEAGGVVAALFSALTLGSVGWIYALFNQGKVLSLAFDVGLPFKLAFGVDALNLFLALIATFMWTLAALYGLEYITERKTIFNSFLLLTLYGLLGLTLSANLFSLLIFFEVFAVASAILVIHENTAEAQRAGFQYLFMSVVGSAAVIFAAAAIFAQTNSLDLLGKGIPGLAEEPLAPAFFWLLMIGFAIKAGMFPVHIWLPVAHPIAPSPASALLSGVMIKVGAYGAIRVIYGMFGVSLISEGTMGKTLLVLAVITMLLGSVIAITQTELKRLLAYSSVAQIGYVMLGIALLSRLGLTGGVLHMLGHALMKGALFLAAGIIIHQTGLRQIRDLAGIAKRLPVTMTAFTLAALSMIGVPPFIGFFSKWFLALGALQAKDSGYISQWSAYGILGVLVLSGLLNIVYYGPILIRGWFADPEGAPASGHGPHGHPSVVTANDGGQAEKIPSAEPGWLMLGPTLVLGLATLFFGLYVDVPLRLVNAVVKLYF